MLLYLKQMVQLILAPRRGWEDIDSHPATGGDYFRRGLLPLMVVAGMSVFFKMFYQFHPSFGMILIGAVITFMQYYLTFYVGQVLLVTCLPHISVESRIDEQKIASFVDFSLGLMCVIGIFTNFFPLRFTLMEFLPIFVVIVMFNAREFLNIRADRNGSFVGLSIAAIILPIYLMELLFHKFI